jgi:hypothetical protein
LWVLRVSTAGESVHLEMSGRLSYAVLFEKIALVCV